MKRWFPDPADLTAERTAAAKLRTLPATPRVVAVCSGAGGVGATTVCAGVAATLAALWPAKVAYSGLAAAPPLPGVRTVDAPLWTDAVDPAAVDRLAEQFPLVFLDVGAHADRTARTLLGRSDRLLVVTDRIGRGEKTASARVDETRPATSATVVVGDSTEHDGDRFGVPHDKALRDLADGFLDRVRPVTRRAFLYLASWCL